MYFDYFSAELIDFYIALKLYSYNYSYLDTKRITFWLCCQNRYTNILTMNQNENFPAELHLKQSGFDQYEPIVIQPTFNSNTYLNNINFLVSEKLPLCNL